MSDNRREALEALRDKVVSDTLHEEAHGGMPMATSCYSFFGDDWRNSPWSDRDCIAAYHGSLDAAKALHESLLPGWLYFQGWTTGEACAVASVWPEGNQFHSSIETSHIPARAWLLSILSALISETPKGETP